MHPRLILLVAIGSLFAQDPVIRLDVQQVLVPVVVTDKKGHHVGGLHKSDFQIFEDGVKQDIAAFSSDTAGSVDDIAALSRPSSGPAAPRTGPRHTFVICVDTLHASHASAERTRQALENLFEKEKPGDAQYVLIGIGRQLQVLEPATTNPLAILLKIRSAAFQNALGGLDASALAAQLQSIRTRMEEFCKRCACAGRPGRASCDSELDALKQTVDGEAERWTAPTKGLVEQFTKVVEELAKLPTGRTLILVSDGFDIDPKREFYRTVSTYLPSSPQFRLDDSKEIDDGLREALKTASYRSVLIDTVDSRGGATASLASDGLVDASGSGAPQGDYSMLGTNRSASTRSAPVQFAPSPRADTFTAEESAAMQRIAHATGGVYFHDSGDMLKQLRGALADGRQYYVIAYTPKNTAHDGKFRAITVETTGKKLNIRAKSGYWAPQ